MLAPSGSGSAGRECRTRGGRSRPGSLRGLIDSPTALDPPGSRSRQRQTLDDGVEMLVGRGRCSSAKSASYSWICPCAAAAAWRSPHLSAASFSRSQCCRLASAIWIAGCMSLIADARATRVPYGLGSGGGSPSAATETSAECRMPSGILTVLTLINNDNFRGILKNIPDACSDFIFAQRTLGANQGTVCLICWSLARHRWQQRSWPESDGGLEAS